MGITGRNEKAQREVPQLLGAERIINMIDVWICPGRRIRLEKSGMEYVNFEDAADSTEQM